MQFQIKGLFTLFLLFLGTSYVQAQIADPIHWDFSTKSLNSCEMELVIKATLETNWHLYGQKSNGEEGPVPTSINFLPDSHYELIGVPSEATLIKKFEPVFGLELNYFEHEALFRQKVKIKSKEPLEIVGDIEFMVCNDKICMPPSNIPFTFKINGCRMSMISSGTVIILLNGLCFIVFLFFSLFLLGAFKKLPEGGKAKKSGSAKSHMFKIVAGFIALAVALKLASNMDVALQLHIISREVFIAVWIVIFGLLGMYLLGAIKFADDDVQEHVSVPRLFLALVVLSFTIYLIPGLWGSPLRMIHFFLPDEISSESINMFRK